MSKKKKLPTKPDGQSKYAKKVAARRRAAARLGLPKDSTWPVIHAEQKRLDAPTTWR